MLSFGGSLTGFGAYLSEEVVGRFMADGEGRSEGCRGTDGAGGGRSPIDSGGGGGIWPKWVSIGRQRRTVA